MSMECIICWDGLTQPVAIPCGHIFCKDCLADHRVARASATGYFPCPVCQTLFHDDPSLVRRLYLPIDDPEPYAPYTKATTIRVYEDLMDHNTRHIIELQDELSKLQVNETTCNVQLREALLANALSAVREKQLKQELTDLHLFLAELGGMVLMNSALHVVGAAYLARPIITTCVCLPLYFIGWFFLTSLTHRLLAWAFGHGLKTWWVCHTVYQRLEFASLDDCA